MCRTTLLAILVVVFGETVIADSSDYKIIDWQYRITIDYGPVYRAYSGLGGFTTPDPWSITRGDFNKAPGEYFMEFYRGRKIIGERLAKKLETIYISILDRQIPFQILKKCNIPLENGDSKNRQEYFVRYTDGRYIYVVSGCLPRFIKYYKATLGNIKFNQDQIRSELLILLKDKILVDSLKFTSKSDSEFYLLNCVNNKLIVSNYNVKAFQYEGRSEAPDLGQPPPMFSDWYNIIEITIYLDKEFMP